jgi:hypothetical protein
MRNPKNSDMMLMENMLSGDFTFRWANAKKITDTDVSPLGMAVNCTIHFGESLEV